MQILGCCCVSPVQGLDQAEVLWRVVVAIVGAVRRHGESVHAVAGVAPGPGTLHARRVVVAIVIHGPLGVLDMVSGPEPMKILQLLQK